MIDFTTFREPTLAVACPDCGKRPGAACVRPSGHKAMTSHLCRKTEADRLFIEQHGKDASIEATEDGGWVIVPNGRVLADVAQDDAR